MEVFLAFAENNRDRIRDAVEKLQPPVRIAVAAAMRAKLDIAKKLPSLQEPLFKQIGRIRRLDPRWRFRARGVEWRPLGCYGPSAHGEFTFLVWAKEVNGLFRPPHAPDTAVHRQQMIPDRRYVKELWLLKTKS